MHTALLNRATLYGCRYYPHNSLGIVRTKELLFDEYSGSRIAPSDPKWLFFHETQTLMNITIFSVR